MKKELSLVAVALLLLVTPVYANPGKGNSDQAKQNNGIQISEEKKGEVQGISDDNESEEDENDLTPTVTPSPKAKDNRVQGISTHAENCDPNADWKNHGAYVSCVAHQHLGGQVVSQAARSDVGKKKVSVTPTISPTETPTPTATPTATLTPTPPITSAEAELTLAMFNWDNLKKAIAHLFQNLPFFS